ncbi:Uncharacterized protein FWK35_00035233, partial [Aphis craccivora]
LNRFNGNGNGNKNEWYTVGEEKKTLKKNVGKRLILTPVQSGGAILLIPIFAGLSSLGSLMYGSASVYNAIQNSKRKKGVFSCNILHKKPLAIECGILNLDVSSGNGSHWVAFYKIKDKDEYFDSFESVTLSLTGNTTTLSVHYCPFIDVYDDSEIALLNLQTYNTFPNIDVLHGIEDIKNQILTQIDDFNNDIDYGIKSTEKITFDIGIDQIDFRTTIFSNGTIRIN